MINGLGGTPISELLHPLPQGPPAAGRQGITVDRSYVGEYCTSLDMAGASVTLAKLDDELRELLDAPAETPIRIY